LMRFQTAVRLNPSRAARASPERDEGSQRSACKTALRELLDLSAASSRFPCINNIRGWGRGEKREIF